MSSATPDAATSASGASSRSHRPRGYRGGQGRRNTAATTTNNTGSSANARSAASAFKGNTTEMNGNVLQRYEEQQDHRQYIKTMEALEAYAKTKLEHSENLATLFITPSPSNPTLVEPVDIPAGSGELKKMMFAEEVKIWMRRERAIRSNLATLHTVIWGQCSEDMKSMVKTHEGYKERTAENDCNWLLRQIKSVDGSPFRKLSRAIIRADSNRVKLLRILCTPFRAGWKPSKAMVAALTSTSIWSPRPTRTVMHFRSRPGRTWGAKDPWPLRL